MGRKGAFRRVDVPRLRSGRTARVDETAKWTLAAADQGTDNDHFRQYTAGQRPDHEGRFSALLLMPVAGTVATIVLVSPQLLRITQSILRLA
jgi:hypothetical protein